MSDGPERALRNRSNTRLRLYAAAAEVFAEIGVGAASVEMLVERAGFTRGAFYSNFESKDDLFFELITWYTDRKLEAVSDRVRELDAEGFADMSVEGILSRTLDVIVDERIGVCLMSEFRSRAMRDERTAEAYLQWQRDMEERVERIVDDIVVGTGIELTLPSSELAQLVMFIWEGTSVQSVIERRPEEGLGDAVRARTLAIVMALVTSNSATRA